MGGANSPPSWGGSYFSFPTGVALDSSGKLLYVADTNNNAVRLISLSNSSVSWLAGTGYSGTSNGVGTAAGFQQPTALAVDAAGNLYVGECTGISSRIRKITPTSVVTSFAGASNGYLDGTGTSATFNLPSGLTLVRFLEAQRCFSPMARTIASAGFSDAPHARSADPSITRPSI